MVKVLALVAATFDLLAGVGIVWLLHPGQDSVPDRVDAIVVFSDDRARVDRAIELMEQGRAGVLVVSKGSTFASLGVVDRCGTTEPFTVLCPEPALNSTRGEAQLFGRLAQEHHWRTVIAVTSRDHVRRAALLLGHCFDGRSTFVGTTPYRSLGEALPHELGGLVQALVDRHC
ncbi:MAG: YdcF family protein [Acidimicrobiales bacterium]